MERLRSLEDLLDLQKVDSEIDRLLTRRSSLPELEAYRGADAEVRAITTALTEAAARLRDTSLAMDKAEGELAMVQSKREVEERRLYAGGMGAREVEHLRQEVEMLGRKTSELEDQILDHMETRERQEGEVAELRQRLAGAEENKARFEQLVAAEWKVIDAELARKEERKTGIVPLIPAELLELYEELRPMKEGVAAGRLADRICGGCHLRLSAAEENDVLKEEIPRCIHCLRILVPQ